MMPLFCVLMPANAKDFFKTIFQIAAFDFVDLTDFYSNLFNIEPTEAIDDNFDEIGFSSRYFLVNMGTLGFFFLIYLILVVTSPLIAFSG